MIADISDRPLASLIDLTGRRALVTGGGRGIGAAVVRRLAEAGARVAIVDLEPDTEETAAVATQRLPIKVDVRDEQSVNAAVDQAVAAFGGLDVLVNCAGIFPAASIGDTTEDLWNAVHDVNLTGSFRFARALTPVFAAQGTGGVIVNFTSTRGLRAVTPNMAAYTSSKHGVIGLTQALALELAPIDVRVIGIAPGAVDTPGVAESAAAFAAAGLGGMPDQIAASVPLGRMLVPDDIARVVLFAVSDLATMVSGSTILVDGARMTL